MTNNLRAERARFNMSREQLSQLLGVHESSIRRWESGVNRPPTDAVIRMSEIFNCTTDWLLGVTDIRTPTHKEAA